MPAPGFTGKPLVGAFAGEHALAAFVGVARSIGFGGGSPNVLYDNVTVTVVPEPGSYALLLAGLGVVGLLGGRRRQR